MGKKAKVGKERRDRYYKLGKEVGYRSRAAFKLIQLNRKFEFLENSRACIDLCAAPGGWLQVACKYMPVSSIIIGIDLVPIRRDKSTEKAILLQADITTARCSELVKESLQDWKVDLVLHDGAPNVGRSWLHDAHAQNRLVLSAFKLACEHLNKGGWFITKVFRSSDSESLFWALRKLFRRVHRTKPSASRSASAESFFVCENFLAPAEIDQRFFDPNEVFADISDFDQHLKKQKADLLKPASKVKKPKARGYESMDVFESVSANDFVSNEDHLRVLAQSHEITFNDDDNVRNHTATTDEIIQCCKDLRVLGKKDLLLLMDWRRKVRKDLQSQNQVAIEGVDNDEEEEEEEKGEEEMQLDDIESMETLEKRRELKRIKRKEEKRRKDFEQRVKYGMVNQGDTLIEEENELFTLKSILSQRHLEVIEDAQPDSLVHDDPDPQLQQNNKKRVTFARNEIIHHLANSEGESEDEDKKDDDAPKSKPESKIKPARTKNEKPLSLLLEGEEGGGLLIGANPVKATKFFDREAFADIDLEKEEIEEIAAQRSSTREKTLSSKITEVENNSESSSGDEATTKRKRLDPEGLALATVMMRSKKSRRDIEDEAWNRYTNADSHLAPKWFRDEEKKYYRRNVPVSQELAKEFRQKVREINQKPIKKVVEAKARQKKRALRKMEKVRKKVESITSNEELTQKETITAIRSVYKNATKSKKKLPTLVVGRKGLPPNKPKAGKYKMVDKRMRKDSRGRKDVGGRKKPHGRKDVGGRKNSHGSKDVGGRKENRNHRKNTRGRNNAGRGKRK